jgi:hypothetical protein
VSIFSGKSTTPCTPAVLAVAHPSWCAVAECRATPDWDADGTGFVAHHARVLDLDGLIVELVQGEGISPQGEVIDQDPIAVLVEGAGWREMTPDLANRLAGAAAVAGGSR